MAIFLGGIFALAMVVASVWDIATFEIPDTISVVLVIVAAGALLAGDDVGPRLLEHGLVAVGLFGLGLLLFLVGYWGGGDVKLNAAAGFWFGWPGVQLFLVVVALVGGVLALTILVIRKLPLPSRAPGWLARLHDEKGIPYGIAIGLGGLCLAATAGKAVTAGWTG